MSSNIIVHILAGAFIVKDESHTNVLIHETSPYLLQHAHNPVDWHSWNEAALTKARAENKPILLSIGYSACHWCHVMAHESFEDADTAALMNRLFLNIKVDREERPDLDRVYQLAHQVLAQRGGGWPLTVFLAPDDLTPFFTGTYFPREPRYGMPGFKEVLTRVAGFYREHQDELHKQNAALKDVFRRIESEAAAPVGELNAAPLDAAYRSLSESFDPRFGGFGRAPKFPHPTSLEFLLWRAADPTTDAETAKHSRYMLETTLTHMAEGGIYDQLGGGFCRYSVDEEWMIPHFEKMLYDNGPLLALYAQTAKFISRSSLPPGEGSRHKATADEGNSVDSLFRRIAKQTAEWVMREMQSPQGGYYSSLDADSEGHEGKYYVWDKEEIRALLNAEEFAVFAPRYGLDQPPNFEGRWHLHVQQPSNQTSAAGLQTNDGQLGANSAIIPLSRQRERAGVRVDQIDHPSPLPGPAILQGREVQGTHPYVPAHRDAMSPLPSRGEGNRAKSTRDQQKLLIESARHKLLAARQKRVRPGLDDKVLTAWNGLMIRGMAIAGHLLDEPRFIDSALRSVNFIRVNLWQDGRLLASWRDGQAKLPAYLDDYAFLLDGVLELLQAHWNSELFNFALQLADVLLTQFEDKQSGGFWFTANDQETPLYRPKTFSDESLPSGNAIAARAMLHLGHLCAEPHYLEAAEHTIKAAMPAVNRYPEAHAFMLLTLQDALEPPTMVVLRGKKNKLQEWQEVLNQKFDPRRIILTIPDDAANLTGLLAQCAPRGDICAYVCRGTQCSLPITEIKRLAEI